MLAHPPCPRRWLTLVVLFLGGAGWAQPVISSVEPGYGLPAGGTQVTIHGANFRVELRGSPDPVDTQVTFNGVPATVLEVRSTDTLVVVTPPGVPGLTEVAVTNNVGATGSLREAFRYTYTYLLMATSISLGAWNCHFEQGARVRVFDESTLAEVAEFPVHPAPLHMAVSRDGRRFFLNNWCLGGWLQVYSAQGALLRQLDGPGYPRQVMSMVLNRDGTRLFVANHGFPDPDSVVELDTETLAIVSTHSIPGYELAALALSPDETKVGVACNLGSQTSGGSGGLCLFATAPASQVTFVSAGDVFGRRCTPRADGVAFTENGRALVLDERCGAVYQVDLPGLTWVPGDDLFLGTSLDLARGQAFAYLPARKKAYVAAPRPAVFDLAARTASFPPSWYSTMSLVPRPDQLGVYFGASPGPASVTLEYVDAATNGVSLSWRNYSSAPWQEYPGAMQVVQLPAPWPPPPLRPPPTGPPNMP